LRALPPTPGRASFRPAVLFPVFFCLACEGRLAGLWLFSGAVVWVAPFVPVSALWCVGGCLGFCFRRLLSGVLVPGRCLIPCFFGVAWCSPAAACPSYPLPGASPRALLFGGSYSSGLVPCRCLAPACQAWLVEVCLCMAGLCFSPSAYGGGPFFPSWVTASACLILFRCPPSGVWLVVWGSVSVGFPSGVLVPVSVLFPLRRVGSAALSHSLFLRGCLVSPCGAPGLLSSVLHQCVSVLYIARCLPPGAPPWR
jgi:hypothetical protein